MIEVEMRHRDRGDVVRLYADRGQVLRESLGPLDGVDVPELRVVLRARARIDQDLLTVPFEEETRHPHLDAVPLVGRHGAIPEDLRHHAEHGAAVQAEASARDEVDLVRTDGERRDRGLHGRCTGVPHKPSSVGSLRGDHFSGTRVSARL
jgi:hypothetical protein